MKKGERVAFSRKRNVFCIIFLLSERLRGVGRGGTQFFRRFGPVRFGTLPKKRGEKSYKSKKRTKNKPNRRYFNIFVKFLQYFDHFTVEIFLDLDYNKTRKSKEGPMC